MAHAYKRVHTYDKLAIWIQVCVKQQDESVLEEEGPHPHMDMLWTVNAFPD